MATSTSNFKMHICLKQLIHAYDNINWSHRLKLSQPLITVENCISYFGQWDPLLRKISISDNLITKNNWYTVLEVLKHEMAHQFVSDKLDGNSSHGVSFQTACDRIGVHPYFRRSKINLDLTNFDLTRSVTELIDQNISAENKLFEKINRLLSLASSTNEFEASSAMNKATALFEKFNIEAHRLNTKKNQFHRFVIDLETKIVSAPVQLICTIISENYNVDLVLGEVFHAGTGSFSKTIELFGNLENLAISEYVFEFLSQTIQTIWSEKYKSGLFRNFHKRSFQLGLLHGFRENLFRQKQVRRAQLDPKDQKSIANLEQKKDLQDFTATIYPRLRKRASSSSRIEHNAFNMGKTEGKKIILNRGLDSKKQGSTLLIK